jgi:WD40 repeat protein
VANPDFYTVGGTVQAEDGIYLSRHADEELLALCLNRIFAYVLTPRQMGKSSLMIRTSEQLHEAGIKTVIIDLNEVGVDVSAEQWYLGILTLISAQLNLNREVIDWWHSNRHLGRNQRLTQFFLDIVLEEISDSIVIFVDEIDTTLSLEFTDDFYAAVRSLYLSRARNSDLHRLSFVLIGVATPSDLISDKNRTPFNIGQRIDLTDFTLEEAMPLAEGLELPLAEARETLGLILDWTNGHPYLTQRLCQALAEQNYNAYTHKEVAEVAHNSFLGEMSRSDDNLRSVRDLMLERSPLLVATLITYREILKGNQPVADEEQSLVKSHLKLSGIVKSVNGNLQVRNAIYREVFNLTWVNENLPINWVKILRRTVYGLVATFFISLIPISIYANVQRMDAVRQRESAEGAREEAEAQRSEAERQREEAEAQREEAVRQRQIAEEAQEEAEIQKTEAEAQREEAVRQRQIAEEARKVAERARREEETQKQLALDREQEARSLRVEAERLRVLAESERIVSQSNLARARFAQGDEIEGLILALRAKRLLGSLDTADIQLDQEIDRATTSLIGAMSEMLYSVELKNILESSGVDTFDKVELFDEGTQIRVKATDCESYEDLSGLWALETREVVWEISGNKVQEIKKQPILGSRKAINERKLELCPSISSTTSGNDYQADEVYTDSIVTVSQEIKVLIPEEDKSKIKVLISENSESVNPNVFLELDQDSEKVYRIKFTEQDKLLALMTKDGAVAFHDTENPKSSYRLEFSNSGLVSDIDFFVSSSEPVFLASIGRRMFYESQRLLPITNYLRAKLTLWSANVAGRKDFRVSNLNADVSSLSVSPNGQLVALGIGTPAYTISGNSFISSFDLGGILLLNADSFYKGGPVTGMIKEARNITVVDFSPNGKLIAAGDSEGKVIIWDYQTNKTHEFDVSGSQGRSIRDRPDMITGIAFNPNGTHLVIVDSSGSGRLWNFSEDESIDLRSSGAFLSGGPTSQFFVTASSQGNVKLWNWLGDEIGNFDIQKGNSGSENIASMSFSPKIGLIALGKSIGYQSDIKSLNSVELWRTDLDSLSTQICSWLSEYLNTNPNVTRDQRELCF